MNEKTSVFGNALIWFGAAVSIAEILTGTLFAPLGFWRALAAIVIGHAIGCVLLYGAGVIGAMEGKSAMEAAKGSFGKWGGKVFAGLNVVQLLGWTAVMIAAGAVAAQAALPLSISIGGRTLGVELWSVVIAVLILVWILAGIGVLQKINILAMVLLFGLSLLLSRLVFHPTASATASGDSLSFGQALELSIAMPVSWLPLIADYTSTASRPRLANLVSTLVYFVGSCWMYLIGMAAALYAGESDIAVVMSKAGLGVAALLIVILSTVTTTFLDVYSAGISMQSIRSTLSGKWCAAAACVIGLVLAVACNTPSFENFLYWIGSVFVPMATVQIMDRLILKRGNAGRNLILWCIGFALYRLFLKLDLSIGSTIPDVVATAFVCWIASLVFKHSK